MIKYPPPSYAANIWMARGLIHVGMDGHTVRIDPSNKEWPRVLLDVLRARDQQQKPSRIAQKASPTQWQLEQALTHVGSKRKHINLEDLFDES